MEHTVPHVGEVGSLAQSPKNVNQIDKEEQMQNQIFSKKKDKRVKKDKNEQI